TQTHRWIVVARPLDRQVVCSRLGVHHTRLEGDWMAETHWTRTTVGGSNDLDRRRTRIQRGILDVENQTPRPPSRVLEPKDVRDQRSVLPIHAETSVGLVPRASLEPG